MPVQRAVGRDFRDDRGEGRLADGQFARQVLTEQTAYVVGFRARVPQQHHQLDQRRLGCHVRAGDDAGLEQVGAGFVAGESSTMPGAALGHGDRDDAPLHRRFDRPQDALVARHRAGAVRHQHDAFEALVVQYVGQERALLDAGEEADGHHVGLKPRAYGQPPRRVGDVDDAAVDDDALADRAQRRVVRRAERREAGRVHLAAAVAAQ